MTAEWKFNNASLTVLPGWNKEGGYESDVFGPPGVDGAITLDNRRRPHRYHITVAVTGSTEYVDFEALVNSGIAADFEVPYGETDAMVWLGAKIESAKMRKPGPDEYREFDLVVLCPNVHPVSKESTGTVLF